jgi:hypothetical protein
MGTGRGAWDGTGQGACPVTLGVVHLALGLIMGLKMFACQKGLGISLKVVNLYRLKDMLKEDDIVRFEDKYERE